MQSTIETTHKVSVVMPALGSVQSPASTGDFSTSTQVASSYYLGSCEVPIENAVVSK